MRRLSTCNTYIQIEEGSGSVKAFYSYGIHKTVEITGTEDERCHVEVLEQNGERFRWSTKRMYLVGHRFVCRATDGGLRRGRRLVRRNGRSAKGKGKILRLRLRLRSG